MAIRIVTTAAHCHSVLRHSMLHIATGTQACVWTCMDSENESTDGSLSGNESARAGVKYEVPIPVLEFATPASVVEHPIPTSAVTFVTPTLVAAAPIIPHVRVCNTEE